MQQRCRLRTGVLAMLHILLPAILILFSGTGDAEETRTARHGSAPQLPSADPKDTVPEGTEPDSGDPDGSSDRSFLYAFMAGRYHLIGKLPDDTTTYHGVVRFTHAGDHLKVRREIGGRRIEGTGTIETALQGEADVLRVRFREAGTMWEITYLWMTDLDNDPVLTGYRYLPGQPMDQPGYEALFHEKSPD